MKRKREDWTMERLTPMLAGLLELIPWIKQWHNDPSDEFGGLRIGDYFEQFLDGECRQRGLSHDDLRAWRPAKKSTRKAKAAAGGGERRETGAGAARSQEEDGQRRRRGGGLNSWARTTPRRPA
jgi:hypothetical protein